MLSEAQWLAFHRDGYLHLGEVVGSGEVEALRQRADDLALGRVVNPNVQMQRDTGGVYEELPDAVDQLDDGTLLYRKIQGLECDDLFARLIQTPVFREICATIYGPHAAVSLFRAMVMNKPAGQGTVLPWHQDGGDVWKLDRDPLVTLWVALDPATRENGCMEAVRGSHRLGILSRYGSTVPEPLARQHCRPEDLVALEAPAGHALLLHNWLIHRSGINPSPIPRRAFTMCCMDARTRTVLTGDHFPVVYGAFESAPDPYVEHLVSERNVYRESSQEAARYAHSLLDANKALEASRDEAVRHAQALQMEAATLRAAYAAARRTSG